MKKAIVLLGGSEFQRSILETAKRHDFATIVIDRNKNAACAKVADHFHPGDITSVEYVTNIVNIYTSRYYILAAISPSEYGIITAHSINRKFSDNIMTDHQIHSLMSKNILSDTLKSLNLNHVQTFSETDIKEYPIIIKPIHGMNSKDVYKCNDNNELHNIVDMLNERYSNDNLLIQKYIEGDTYGMKLFYDRKILDKYFIKRSFDRNFLPTGGIVPYNIGDNLSESISNMTEKLFEKLGIKYGVFESDFIIDKNGYIYILEITPQFDAFTSATVTKQIHDQNIYDIYFSHIKGLNIKQNVLFESFKKVKQYVIWELLYPVKLGKNTIRFSDKCTYSKTIKEDVSEIDGTADDKIGIYTYLSKIMHNNSIEKMTHIYYEKD